MILEYSLNNKKILLFISIIFLIVGFFLSLHSPVIFQEGSFWPQVKGIIRLTFGNEDIVKLSGSNNKYLTKNKDGLEIIGSFLKSKGYSFTEQMGSGYFYKSFDDNVILTRRQYSCFYVIWTITGGLI